MEEQEPEPLRFFRPLLHDFSTQLILPSDFAQRIKTSATQTATLISPIGGVWRVNCYKESKEVYMGGSSWREFVHANRLKVGYALVLHHKGNMVFSFRAFDLSTREIAYSSVITPKVPIKEEEELVLGDSLDPNFKTTEEDHPEKRRSDGQNAEKMMQMRGTQTARFEVVINACNLNRRRRCLHVPARFTKSCSILKGHDEVTVEDPKGRAWPIGLFHCNRSGTIYISKGWLEFARANELKVGNRCIFKLVSRSNSSKLKMSVGIFNGVSFARPQIGHNASGRKGRNVRGTRFHATITICNLHRDYMNIPGEFVKYNLQKECTEMKLRDPEGQMWPVCVYYRYKPDYRANLSRGWREFARGNRLEVGDRCIFELVSDDDDDDIVLQVQILKNRQLKLVGSPSFGAVEGVCKVETVSGGAAAGSGPLRVYVRRGRACSHPSHELLTS